MYKIKDIVNKIHCADCLEFMREMPDKCVDLVLTDPPYGINVCKMQLGNRTKESFVSGDWDSCVPGDNIFDELFRISKNQIVFGGNYFKYLPTSRSWIVWDKNNGDSSFADGELIWTSFNKPLRIYKVHWCGSAPKWEDSRGKVHPTQKPTRLIKWCLNYAGETNIILDPFLGSGTTAVACKELNRKYIGIEINPEYCKIAEKRLANTQGSLF